jgi:hypothetical protein
MMSGGVLTIAGIGWLFDNQTLPALLAMAAIPIAGYGYCWKCQRLRHSSLHKAIDLKKTF